MTCTLVAIASCFVTLFGIYIAQQLGIIQISYQRRAHELNLTKSAPKIGSSIEIDQRYDNGRNYPASLYLITTIYNEGELPASQLNGNWKLTSSYGVPNRIIPIQWDFLGSTPYKFEAPRIGESGTAAHNQFVFEVDIEFDYSIATENEPQHYSAKYRYDYEHKRMNRI